DIRVSGVQTSATYTSGQCTVKRSSWPESASRHGRADPDLLAIHELPDAVRTEFTTESRALHAAARQPRIRLHDAVDGHLSRDDLARHLLSALDRRRPHARAEPVRGVVGHRESGVGVR